MGWGNSRRECVKARFTPLTSYRFPNKLCMINVMFPARFARSGVLANQNRAGIAVAISKHRKRGGKRSWLCSQKIFLEQNGVNSLVASVANTKDGSSTCKFLVRILGLRSKDERWPLRGSYTNAMGPRGTPLS